MSIFRGSISGTHPLSDQLITKIMDHKYGRDTVEPVKELFQNEYKQVVELQKSLGFPNLTSGTLGLEDLIRPFTRSLEALKSYEQLGDLPINRFHYTNTFFRQPTLKSKLPDESAVILMDNNTLTGENSYGHHHLGDQKAKIVLPGPYTFTQFVLDGGVYGDPSEYIEAAGRFLEQELEKLPSNYKEVQFDEPTFVWDRVPRKLRKSINNAYQSISTVKSFDTSIVHTYFESANNILDFLTELPVSGVGIDLTKTNILDLGKTDLTDKVIQAGIVDSQNYIPNGSGKIDQSGNTLIQSVLRSIELANPKEIIVTPTTTLEYLPREIADQVLGQISNIVKEVSN